MNSDLKEREVGAGQDNGDPAWYAGRTSYEDDLAAAENGNTDKKKDSEETPKNTSPQDDTGSHQQKTEDVSYVKKLLLQKKKGFAILLLGGLVGGGFGFFTIIAGPLQIMHAGQLLQKFHLSRVDDFMDGRSGRFVKYLAAGTPARGRLGYASDKYATRWENRMLRDTGLKSVYTQRPNQRFVGYQIVDSVKAQSILSDLEADGINPSSSITEDVVDIDGVNRNSSQGDFIDLSDERLRNRRSVVRVATRGTGVNRLSSSLGSRMLIRRGGVDFAPLKNIRRAAGESTTAYYRKVKDALAQKYRTGNTSPRIRAAQVEEPDADGETTRNTQPDSAELIDDVNNIDLDSSEGRSRLRNNVKLNLISKVGSITAVVGVVCTVNAIGDQADELKQEQIATQMRMGMDFVTTASQLQAMDNLNIDEVGAMASRMHDGETSFFSANSIQANDGREAVGPELADSAKIESLESQPLAFEVISGIPGVTSVCAVDEAVGNLPIIKQIGEIGEAAINIGLGAIGTSIEDLMESVVNAIAGELVNVDAEGAELGGLADQGVALASNEQMLSVGGNPLTDSELAAVQQTVNQTEKDEYTQKGFLARTLNIYDIDSLLGRLAYSFNSISMKSFITQPTKLLSFATTPTVFAASNYDYGFDMYGFSIEEQQDERFADPFENADWVETGDRLNTLNSVYGGCFGIRIDPGTGAILSSDDAFDYAERAEMDECTNGSSQAFGEEGLLRFRFYIADMMTDHTLACYEGEAFSCQQVGMAGGQSRTTGQANASSSIVGDPYTDGVDIACADGTNDLGTSLDSGMSQAYSSGEAYDIRFCEIPNIPSIGQADTPGGSFSTPGASGFAIVSSRVSGAWYALAEDAKADGIDLQAFSSFRSMAHQTSNYESSAACPGANCLIARPGYSSHQAGVAIDFENGMRGVTGGSTCETRAKATDSEAWSWLKDNAENYGFKQYSREAWHWDALPSDNRCGTLQI